MKRILFVLLALSLVAGFSTVYAAEDGLVDFSGTMRVKGYYDENLGGGAAWDNDDPRDEREYWDQRFRIYTKFTPAEGVSAHLRADYSEVAEWGTNNGLGRPDTGFETIHLDRAFLELDKELFTLRGGLQLAAWGVTIPVDYQFMGWSFSLKTPVKVDLAYGKNDENGRSDQDWASTDIYGDTSDPDDTTSKDSTTYALQVSYASEMFSIGTILGTTQDRTTYDRDDDLEMWSLWAKANFGMFSFAAEIDAFGGEIEQAPGVQDIDYMGTQFYFLATVKLSDVFQIDGELFWAQGTDEGGESAVEEETQACFLARSFGLWSPQTLIHADGEYNQTINQNGHTSPFEMWDDAGAIGGIISAEFTAMPGLKFLGQLGYFQAEEEDLQGMDYDKHWEDQWWIQAGMSWTFMEAARLDLVAFYTDISFSGDDDDPRNASGGDGDATGHGHTDDTDDDPDDSGWGLLGILTVSF